MPIPTVLLAAALGLALGPALAAWAERAIAHAPVFAAGWWRGGEAPITLIVVMTLAAAVLFAAFAFRFTDATVLAWCWMAATGLVLAVVDLRARRLPHRVTAAMALGGFVSLGIAAAIGDRWGDLLSAVGSGMVVWLIAVLVQVTAPTHVGGGDTALYAALALNLGWFGLTGLLRGLVLATVLTALVAVIVWIRHRSMTATFPAGPPLIAGALAGIVLA